METFVVEALVVAPVVDALVVVEGVVELTAVVVRGVTVFGVVLGFPVQDHLGQLISIPVFRVGHSSRVSQSWGCNGRRQLALNSTPFWTQMAPTS